MSRNLQKKNNNKKRPCGGAIENSAGLQTSKVAKPRTGKGGGKTQKKTVGRGKENKSSGGSEGLKKGREVKPFGDVGDNPQPSME